MKEQMKLVLSGAITGHEKEAEIYFMEAERAVQARYPLAQIFNPIRLPKLPSWEAYMTICRSRIKHWATGIVYVDNNPYRKSSKGAAEEENLSKERLLRQFEYDGITVEEIDA